MKLPLKFSALALVAAAAVCACLPAQTNAPAATVAKFAYGGDAAEIPAQFTDNLVFLSAGVNLSEPSLFEVDTTAEASSIAPDRAAEIGRTDRPSPVLNFLGLDVSFPVLPSRPNDGFGPRVGQPYRGTLGNDFLSCLVLEIDYARETVRAFSPQSFKPAAKAAVFPFKQGIPVISAQFALAKGKEVRANFIVNTALDAPVLFSNKFLAGHKMLSDRGRTVAVIDPVSGTAGASVGRLKDFRIGALAPDDVLATFSDAALPDVGGPVAGEIGAGMLRRFVAVFDFPHHQLTLTPTLRFADPDQEDKSGLLIVGEGPDYKRFEVVDVEPHTPAADAGIQKGDIIAGVDAEAAADLSLLVTRDLFRQVGHKYKLLIERNGETKAVSLQMRRYF